MAKVTVDGQAYDLRMTLWAAEQLEKEYGDIRKALDKFQKEKNIPTVKKMFKILANAGRKVAKKPMDVRDDALDNISMYQLNEISKAMKAALDESAHAETVDGNEADDEAADAYAAELEQQEKNASTGGE